MYRVASLFCSLIAIAAAQAHAQTAGDTPSWSLTFAASGSATDADNSETFRNGSISLERNLSGYWFGASIGASGGDAFIPEVLTITDTSSFQGSVWWGADLGGANLTLNAGYGRQSLDGLITPPATAPAAIRSRRGNVDGEVVNTSVTATLARSFGDAATWTPYATLTWSQTETDIGFSTQTTNARLFTGGSTASGISGGVGVDASFPVSEQFDFTAGASFLAAENGAATLYTQRRAGGFQPSIRQPEGAVQWGEIYGGANLHLSANASLSGSIGTTLGRDQDERFASASVGFSF